MLLLLKNIVKVLAYIYGFLSLSLSSKFNILNAQHSGSIYLDSFSYSLKTGEEDVLISWHVIAPKN